MYKSLFFSTLALVLTACPVASISATLDASDAVGYIRKDTYSSGWGYVKPATDGLYAHGVLNQKDANRPDHVFMIGKPSRQEFDAFTASEGEALWRYRHHEQALLEAAQKAALRPVTESIQRAKRLLKLKWPRITVNGNKVCAPSIDASESPDWKDHLLCTHLEPHRAR